MNERVKPTKTVRCHFLEWHELVDISVSGAGFLGPESSALVVLVS